MIFDHRTYTCLPGRMKKHMAMYAQNGWEPQSRHLGQPVFYGATDTGDVNSYVHIWVYEDAADRDQKRANLQADPEWQTYLKMSAEAGNLLSQKTKILTPVPFFNPKL